MKYLFQLGRHPDLSRAEIEHLLRIENISIVDAAQHNNNLILAVSQSIDSQGLMQRLGGSISIARAVSPVSQSDKDIAEYLANTYPEGKIVFSLHGNNAKRIALNVKKQLKQLGHSVRYVEENNTATILHNKLVEKKTDLTLANGLLFVTEAIQPIEELSARDYGRPGRDAKSGMLPPKLAKIMINLAGATDSQTLLDPFCGSGTILIEALLLGHKHLLGSDISDKAVADSKKNIEWTLDKQTTHHTRMAQLFHTDVKKLTQHIKPQSVDAIATEPYLGSPLSGGETKEQLQKQARELATLYIAAFTTFQSVLKKTGVVVFIIPQFLYNKNEWISVDCIEKIKRLGFVSQPLVDNKLSLVYHRPGQFVGRSIWKFSLNRSSTTRQSMD